MPRVSEMLPSKYLKKEDFETPQLVTISHVEIANLAQDGEPKNMKWVMFFNEHEKGLVTGATTLNACKEIFKSDNTDDWIGGKVVLYNDPNVTYLGKITGGVRLRAPKKNVPVKTAPQPKAADLEEIDPEDVPF